MDCETTAETAKIIKWARLLVHPSLPSRSEQLARARGWGLDDRGSMSPIIEDDISKVGRTTNWAGKMPNWTQFLPQIREGWQIFFATPRCIGFSAAQAKDTIGAIWMAGAEVYVHSTGALYRAGDDISELLAKVASEQNVTNVRTHKRRKSVAKRKSKQST